MKNFIQLASFLMVVMVLTGSAFAYFNQDKPAARSSHLGVPKEDQAIFASHGKNNVYWLTASIDEYENKPGNLTKVQYID